MGVRIEGDAEAPAGPAGDGLAELGEPDRRRIAHALPDAVPQRLEDRRIRRLARIAHPEVDHLEPLGPPLGRRLCETHERIRLLRLAGWGRAARG